MNPKTNNTIGSAKLKSGFARLPPTITPNTANPILTVINPHQTSVISKLSRMKTGCSQNSGGAFSRA